MTPSVDKASFLALMAGQCEPGFSSYEINKKRVRLANIDTELWYEEGATQTFAARVNTIEGETEERTVTTAYTPEDAARAKADWRVTQQESVLKFPCYPSDVKRWAEAQFLEVGQDLEDACNDEILERLAEETGTSQGVSQEDAGAYKKQHLQEQAILNEIQRQGLDPLDLHFQSGKPGDKRRIAAVLLKDNRLFTDKAFCHAWDRLSAQGKIKNSRA